MLKNANFNKKQKFKIIKFGKHIYIIGYSKLLKDTDDLLTI